MKRDKVYLQHILQEIDFLLSETHQLNFEDFRNNEVLTRACARSLEIIGEASKNLSKDLRDRQKDVEWKKISGLRDKMVHHYFGIDWDIVWDVIKNHLPQLKEQVDVMLRDLEFHADM